MDSLREYIYKELKLDKRSQFILAVDKIGELYKKFIKDYLSNNRDSIEDFDNFPFNEFIKLIGDSGIESNNIPYTYITRIIFNVEIPIEKNKGSGIEIREFVELFRGAFEDYLDNKYKKSSITNGKLKQDKETIHSIMMKARLNQNILYNYDENRVNNDLPVIKLVYKLIDHIELAIEQKIGLYEKQKDQIKSINEQIKNEKTSIDKITKETEKLKGLEKNIDKITEETEKLKGLEKNIGKIYTEFVAILGIFASIIFGVFGGFQEIQLIGKNLNTTPIPKLLIFSSLVMLGVTLIIFLCFNAISKLTNMPMRSCNCKAGECNCSFRKRHPTIFYSSCIYLYVLLVGFALRLYKYNDFKFSDLYNGIPKGYDILPLLLLILPLIPLLIGLIIYVNRKRKEYSYKKQKEERARKRTDNIKKPFNNIIKAFIKALKNNKS
ncbi:hypothetical protein [Staphylococcus hominis]|uniref:hypothetical protein n=1 Tax=Staphylococcus hominis TaxID=1290 RepID=UPI0022E58EC9|nr:hypothetical protein [Staphylococcus hominis]